VSVYGEGGMKEGNVREWCRLFKKGRSNVHYEERGGRLSLAADDSNTKISGKRSIQNCCITRIFFLVGGQSLRGDQDTKDVLDWLKGLAATFCDEGIRKLVPRCDRCRNLHDDYVEK
jgi:hypothetical protein